VNYVVAGYLITIVTLGVYALILWRKSR